MGALSLVGVLVAAAAFSDRVWIPYGGGILRLKLFPPGYLVTPAFRLETAIQPNRTPMPAGKAAARLRIENCTSAETAHGIVLIVDVGREEWVRPVVPCRDARFAGPSVTCGGRSMSIEQQQGKLVVQSKGSSPTEVVVPPDVVWEIEGAARCTSP